MDNGGSMPTNNSAPQPSNPNPGPLPDYMTQSTDTSSPGDKKFKTILIIASAIILISVALLIVITTGGGHNNGQSSSGDKSNENSNVPAPDEAELERIAKSYSENLIQNNYSSNYRLLALPENSVITVGDYTDFVNKKPDYKKINQGMKVGEIKKTNSKDNTYSYSVRLIGENEDKSTSITLAFAYKGGSWGVDEKNFYIADWSIIIPSGAKLYIDGAEVPDTLVKNDEKVFKYSSKYVIPAIYSAEKNFQITHPLANKIIAITPTKAESGKEYYLELKDERIVSSARDFVKEAWNAIYTAYANDNKISDLSQYLDGSMSEDDVNNYFKKPLDSLSEGSNDSKNTDFQLTDIVASKSDCYILSKDIITINFGYTLNWKNSKQSSTQAMTRYSKIRLLYDGESFKIVETPDERLFGYSSNGVKEF